MARRVVPLSIPKVKIIIKKVKNDPYAGQAAGLRCLNIKVATGALLKPHGAGVVDARGRREASPRAGGLAGKRNKCGWLVVRAGAKKDMSVLEDRLPISARKPRSGAVARSAN